MGKQSLLRTLKTLGSVPDWGAGNVLEDSDEEKDASTTVKTVKKKRCKKRKRKSNAENEGKQLDKVDSSEPPVKKKKKPVKKTIKQTSENMFQSFDVYTLKHYLLFHINLCLQILRCHKRKMKVKQKTS